MKKHTFFSLLTAILLLFASAIQAQNEQVIYTTGFESTDGFTASTVYNNTAVAFTGEAGKQWGTYFGTPSTTSPLTGTQSMQMRWYTTATANLGYTYTNFDLANVTKVRFSAANTLGLNVIVSYSTDGGVSYTGGETFVLTGTKETYTYTVSAAGVHPSVRLKFQITYATAPGGTARLYLDDIEVFGMVSGTPTAAFPTFSITGFEKVPGTYFNTASVSLNSETEGATIHYTTNGSTPTTSSTVYSTPIVLTTTTTIKAMAVKSGMDNSAVTERTITIVPPATATIPFAEAFTNTLGDWYSYRVAGDKPWVASTNGAYVNGYGGGDVKSWLISPQFTAPTNGLALSFNYASRFTGNAILVRMSQNYAGFGDPTAATWTDIATILAPTEQDNNYTVKASGNIIAGVSGQVHFALVYDTDENYSDWRITNASVVEAPSPNEPQLSVVQLTVPAMTADVNQSTSGTITVNGLNLTADVTLAVSGTNAGFFSVQPATISPVAGKVENITVTITYAPTAAGTHAATLTLSTAGVTPVTRALSGTALAPPPPVQKPAVIITEIYGGGGNSGAPYTHDFFILYNNTELTVDISGWSVQYYAATSTGKSSNFIPMPEGSMIPSRTHFLIRGGGGTTGDTIPSPNVIGGVNASATAGKLILFKVDTAQTIVATDISSILLNPDFVDYVPFGTTAIPVLGAAMTANASNTTAYKRKKVDGEYVYTHNMAYDFEIGTPEPIGAPITSVRTPYLLPIMVHEGAIRFNATAGELIELYNPQGQLLLRRQAADGMNAVEVPARGMIIVRVGNATAKVLM